MKKSENGKKKGWNKVRKLESQKNMEWVEKYC